MIPIRFFRRWARNILTIIALAISFSMVLSLASISMGLHNASQDRLKDSPRDLVVTSVGLEPSIEEAHSSSILLRNDKKNFTAAMPLLTLIGRIAIPDQDEAVEMLPGEKVDIDPSGYSTREIGVLGLIPYMAEDFIVDDKLIVRSEHLEMDGWFKERGDPFHESRDESDFTSEIILDRTLMKEFGLKEGNIIYYIGRSGDPVASLSVTGSVGSSLIGTGLTKNLVSGIALLHLSELQFLTGHDSRRSPYRNRTDLANVIYLDLEEDRKSPRVQNEIVMMLEEQFPGLKVTSRESRLYRIEEEVMVLQIFALGVAITTLFIGALFLSSIMILDVEDRKGEISVMRAIGISNRTIYLQILKDTLLISLIAGAIGMIPGYLGSRFLDSSLRSIYGVQMAFSRITPSIMMISLVFFMVFVLSFSILPGYRSTSMDIKKGLASFKIR